MTERIHAEVPGTVLQVPVAQGARVAAGDTIAVLESMKMEIPVLTEVDGQVQQVAIGVGDVVQDGELLVVIDDEAPQG